MGGRSEELEVAILGAGLSGICLGVRLLEAGITRFLIFERAERLGGTWRDNVYPSTACDVPAHLYSFSFAPKWDWTRRYAGQAEILAYVEWVARRHRLDRHFRFATEIVAARYVEEERRWRIAARGGAEFEARALVSACGQLSIPQYPEIAGLDRFAGKAMHSARWDASYDFRDKRVAVIGTGASAAQLVPALATRAARLHVFQRSPNWIVPRRDRAYGALARWALRDVPLARRLYRSALFWRTEARFFAYANGTWANRIGERLARRHLDRAIAASTLRAGLTPDYPFGCRRVLVSDDYYPALLRPNVELVTAPIDRIERQAIVASDGPPRAVDAIVYATGFDTRGALMPVEFTGVGGARLAGAAYLGMTVPDFPNFFMMYGPNTNLGHTSLIFMIECQARYIAKCLERALAPGALPLAVTTEAMARYTEALDRRLARSVWAAGCRSWYQDASGRIANNWASFAMEYWWRTRRPVVADYG